jgi:hemolysin activation/secretion protein
MRTTLGSFSVAVSGGLLMLAGASAAFAQTQPDNAGAQVLRRVEPPAIPEPAVKPRKEITIAEPSEASGAKVSVQSFVFEGNRLLNADDLAVPLKRFVGQQLALAELNYAADLIGKLYQERGFFARVVVPSQDVLDGIVRIQIEESRLDRVEIDPSAASGHDDRMRAYVGAGLKQGDPLDLRRIERGTLLLNQLPGSSFRTLLRAGSSEATSSIVVMSELAAGQNYSATVDNAGSTRSGRERVLLSASLHPILAFGDDLSLFALASRGVQYGRAAYSLPIGSDGLSANLALSGLRYELRGTPVKIKGDSEAAIAGLRYPLVLQSDRAVQLSFEGGYRRFSDRVATVVTNRSLAYGSAAIDVSRADTFLAGGSSAIGASLLAGRGSLDGGFVRVSGYVQRRQQLSKRDAFSLRVMGQIGSDKLDQSQFLMINGANGVMAASNDDDVSGRSGLVGRATFEHQFAPVFRVSAFYDLGKVYGGAANRPSQLQGVGVGAVLQVARVLVIDASVSQPINTPDTFNDKTKAWVSARVAF